MTTDKTIKSKNQPKQTNVTWVDLSRETPVEKHFINGRWVATSSEGSGGTTDYSRLNNKPSINGVELDGDKLFSDLTDGKLYGGIINTQSTVQPDTSCYYIAEEGGNYSAFGVTVNANERVQIIIHNGTAWEVVSLNMYNYGYAHGKFDKVDDIDSLLTDIVPSSASASNQLLTERERHFKGWYDSSSNLPANPVIGDYAYVKGGTASDPATIYECTTAGTWSNSGRTADTSNVQTFASGEEVNEVHIVNDLTTGGTEDVLSAEQGKELNNDISYTTQIALPATLISGRYLNSSNVVNSVSSTYFNIAYFDARNEDWVARVVSFGSIFSGSYPIGAIAIVDSLDDIEVDDTVIPIVASHPVGVSFLEDEIINVPAGKILVVFEIRYSINFFDYFEIVKTQKVGTLDELNTLNKGNCVDAINEISEVVFSDVEKVEITPSIVLSRILKANIISNINNNAFRLAYFTPRDNDYFVKIETTTINISSPTGAVCLVDSLSELDVDDIVWPTISSKQGSSNYTMDVTIHVPANKILAVFDCDYQTNKFSYYELKHNNNIGVLTELDTDDKVSVVSSINEVNAKFDRIKTRTLLPNLIYGRSLNGNVVTETTAGNGTAFNIAYFNARENSWKANVLADVTNASIATGAVVLVDSLDDIEVGDTVTPVVDSHPSGSYTMNQIVDVPANKILVVFEMNYYASQFTYKEIVNYVDGIDTALDLFGNPDYIQEDPLAIIKETAGYTAIFRTMGVIGGSMSSGAHSSNQGTQTLVPSEYAYSSLQFMARLCGAEGFNFSRGGMSAHDWPTSDTVGGASDLFNNNPCQMYLIQLGNNDSSYIGQDGYALGTTADLNGNNGVFANTFFGKMGNIIQKIREVQPRAYVFLSTFLKGYGQINKDFNYNQAIRDIVTYYNNPSNRSNGDELHYYLIDYYTYGKPYSYYYEGIHDETVRGSHLVATGYLLWAYQYCTYIDWIIKNNMSDFNDVAFVGSDRYYRE